MIVPDLEEMIDEFEDVYNNEVLEMTFKGEHETLRDMIVSVFGIPEQLLGVQNSWRAPRKKTDPKST